ncbi:MAG: endonuclease III [Candidatus Marinimicrobia bacterium]|nr:endonuclease III [Candidatus Neomarinimicrobiota bacterium]
MIVAKSGSAGGKPSPIARPRAKRTTEPRQGSATDAETGRGPLARAVLRGLRRMYPDAACALHFAGPYQLAVATILSAQCTDTRVNQVTPALFARFPDVAAWLSASPAEVEALIRPTGFFRNKARNLCALAQAVQSRWGGRLPETLEELITLPGIGRKTANVILSNGFGRPGLAVDTHCQRVCRRIGLTAAEQPDQIERELKALLPRTAWSIFSHAVIAHGRSCCQARRPACPRCPLRAHCAYAAQARPPG